MGFYTALRYSGNWIYEANPCYFLSSYGRYLHFCYARHEKYAYPVYDCDECLNGGVYRIASIID